MFPHTKTLLALALTALPAAALGEPTTAERFADEIENALAVLPDGDALRGTGPGYSASFEAGGWLFSSPSNDPTAPDKELYYEFESARLGDDVFHLAHGSTLASSGGARRAEYDHAPGLVERYDVRSDGIEQSFVFESLPVGDGDLVVSGRLHTDMELVGFDPIKGLVFEGPGGTLRYGGVTGIDAKGERVTGWVDLVGDRLELGLPAEFVEDAALPIVLDPLIGSDFEIDIDGFDAAVAYASGYYLVVWVDRNCNEPCPDIVQGEFLFASGASAGNIGSIYVPPLENFYASDVSVGTFTYQGQNRFLVAWEQVATGTGSTNIFFAVIEPGETSSPDVGSLGVLFSQHRDPDVGFESGTDRGTIVWQHLNDGIRGANVTTNTSGDSLVLSEYSITADAGDTKPRLASSPAAGSTKFCVWHREPGGALNSIRARMWTGLTPSDPEFSIRIVGNTLRTPDVTASSHDDFLVVWTEEQSGDPDVRGRRVSFPGGLDAAEVKGSIVDIGADADPQEDPKAIFTGNGYLVSYLEGLGSNWVVAGRALDSKTLGELSGPTFDFPADVYQRHDLASVSSLPLDNDNAMAIWVEDGEADVEGQLFQNDGGFVTVFDVGCFSSFDGGEARVGTASAGNSDFSIELWHGEPGVPAFVSVGWAPINLPLGEATLVPHLDDSVLFLAGVTDANGYASLPVAIPSTFGDVLLYAQFATSVLGETCTGYDLVLSDAVSFLID